MIFEQLSVGGCRSYVIGCPTTFAAALIDPQIQLVDHYRATATRDGLTILYASATHTHADHFSGSRQIGEMLDIPVVMHRDSPAPFVDLRLDDGQMLLVGDLRVTALHTPGHTRDSMCLVTADRVFTGDTLLIGGTGRTDLPTGDPDALYDSLFGKLLELGDGQIVFPPPAPKGRSHTTLGAEKASNPRLQKKERPAFVELMRGLDIAMPQHLTEALRTNRTGGKTVKQLILEASKRIAFMSMGEVKRQLDRGSPDFLLLDVREREAFRQRRLPGALNIPRGELELRADKELPDPTVRVLTYCQFGKISTLAAYTLREMGYQRAVALDGGLEAW